MLVTEGFDLLIPSKTFTTLSTAVFASICSAVSCPHDILDEGLDTVFVVFDAVGHTFAICLTRCKPALSASNLDAFSRAFWYFLSALAIFFLARSASVDSTFSCLVLLGVRSNAAASSWATASSRGLSQQRLEQTRFPLGFSRLPLHCSHASQRLLRRACVEPPKKMPPIVREISLTQGTRSVDKRPAPAAAI